MPIKKLGKYLRQWVSENILKSGHMEKATKNSKKKKKKKTKKKKKKKNHTQKKKKEDTKEP